MPHEITGASGALLGLAIEATNMRQAVAAQNIANAGSEHYRTTTVHFEEFLDEARQQVRGGRALKRGDAVPSPVVTQEIGQHAAVQLDVEVSKLASNAVHQQALLKMLNRHLSILSMAINEGRR